jgi:hypothetical protein
MTKDSGTPQIPGVVDERMAETEASLLFVGWRVDLWTPTERDRQSSWGPSVARVIWIGEAELGQV